MMRITATVNASGSIPNTATVTNTSSATEPDPISANNTSAVTLNASGKVADLGVVKMVDKLSANVGEQVTFTVTVTNYGPHVASNVMVADNVPTNLTFLEANASQGTYTGNVWTVGALQPGQSAVLRFAGLVGATGKITNTAVVSNPQLPGQPLETDPVGGNDRSTAEVNATQAADLVITKTVNNLAPKVGDVVTWTMTVKNNGPNDAAQVSVTDLLDSRLTVVSASPSVGTFSGATWTIGTLPIGQVAVLQIATTVTNTGSILNTATVTQVPTSNDPISANNSASATINSSRAVDVSVTKTVDNLLPIVGEKVTFTVVVKNNGPNAATNVQVVDNDPAGLTSIQRSVTTGTVSGATWTIPNLAVGESVIMQLSGLVNTTGAITNTVQATLTDDPILSNNTSAATLNASRAADLMVSKTVDKLDPKVGETQKQSERRILR